MPEGPETERDPLDALREAVERPGWAVGHVDAVPRDDLVTPPREHPPERAPFLGTTLIGHRLGEFVAPSGNGRLVGVRVVLADVGRPLVAEALGPSSAVAASGSGRRACDRFARASLAARVGGTPRASSWQPSPHGRGASAGPSQDARCHAVAIDCGCCQQPLSTLNSRPTE